MLINWTEETKHFFFMKNGCLDKKQQSITRLKLFFCKISRLLSATNPLFSENEHPYKCIYIAFVWAVFKKTIQYTGKFAVYSSYISI